MSAKGNAIRWSRWRAEKAAEKARRYAYAATPEEPAAIARTKCQLAALDALIDDSLAKGDEERFLKLSAAKERLWKLVQPTAGSLRPGRQQRQQTRPSAEPISIPATEPPSVG
jgi:hypothetical protein